MTPQADHTVDGGVLREQLTGSALDRLGYFRFGERPPQCDGNGEGVQHIADRRQFDDEDTARIGRHEEHP